MNSVNNEQAIRNNPVLISIDTEGPAGSDPVRNMIYGNTKRDGECGIRRLMDCFDTINAKGLFFVDVAEVWDYGEDKILGVIEDIKNRGHDVGMHVHPDHMADKNRRYLWEYTYDEQKDILTKCTKWYLNNVGEHPKYFRAGRYGLDNNTLKIISDLGYEYDFSEFYGKKGCKISPPITCNKVVKIENIKEIPVSVYKSFKCSVYERYDKLDISLEKGEFLNVVNNMKCDPSVDVISFFLHSFSLLEWRTHVDNPTFVKKEEEKLLYLLKYMKENNYNFINASDLDVLDIYDGDIQITDYSKMKFSLFYFFRRALNTVKMRLQNNV